MTKSLDITASIAIGLRCKECGWPVVLAACNDNFLAFAPDEISDWWYYCANKSCNHHHGEGVFQDVPDWIEQPSEQWLKDIQSLEKWF